MGTRNLTIVKSVGKTKVCQYGQWDGYPTGQGQTIADFLNGVNLKEFKKKVDALKVWSSKGIEDAYVEAGAKRGAELVDIDVSNRVKMSHPELSRDTGAEILNLIDSETVKKVNLKSEDYKNDSSCEYWYELNLDTNIITMNGKKFSFKLWKTKGFMEKLQDE